MSPPKPPRTARSHEKAETPGRSPSERPQLVPPTIDAPKPDPLRSEPPRAEMAPKPRSERPSRRPRARRARDSGVRPAALLARARRTSDRTGNSETDLPVAPTSVGALLRRERRVRGASLEEIAQTTRIPLKMLRHIEADEMDELPGDVFARGFIKAYARALGLDEALLLNGIASEMASAPSPLATVNTPERGRRFGIAIAIFVLVILFTLALSIVLRPRHRDEPVRLSSDSPSAFVDQHVA